MGVLGVSWDCWDTLYWRTIRHSCPWEYSVFPGIAGTQYRGTIGHSVYPRIAGILCIGRQCRPWEYLVFSRIVPGLLVYQETIEHGHPCKYSVDPRILSIRVLGYMALMSMHGSIHVLNKVLHGNT